MIRSSTEFSPSITKMKCSDNTVFFCCWLWYVMFSILFLFFFDFIWKYCFCILFTVCYCEMKHDTALVQTCCWPFLIVLSLGSWRTGAAGQYLASLSALILVTCMWPRRSVSRSQQWKQSLSSTQSGQSRSLKMLKTSWIKSTLLLLRRGGSTLFISVFWVPFWHSCFCISTNLFQQATVKWIAHFNAICFCFK